MNILLLYYFDDAAIYDSASQPLTSHLADALLIEQQSSRAARTVVFASSFYDTCR